MKPEFKRIRTTTTKKRNLQVTYSRGRSFTYPPRSLVMINIPNRYNIIFTD